MGSIAHDVVIVTTNVDWGYTRGIKLPDVDAFRRSLPPEFAQLVIGPVDSTMNGYVSFAWMPDGSKEGWDHSEMADEFRTRFVNLFRNLGADVVTVRFGGDVVHAEASFVDDEGWRDGGRRPV